MELFCYIWAKAVQSSQTKLDGSQKNLHVIVRDDLLYIPRPLSNRRIVVSLSLLYRLWQMSERVTLLSATTLDLHSSEPAVYILASHPHSLPLIRQLLPQN